MTSSKPSGRVHSALVVRRSLHNGDRFAATSSVGQASSQPDLSSLQTVLDIVTTTPRCSSTGGLDRVVLVQILDEALSIGAATLAEQPKSNGTEEQAKR
jgi:hypothetical protein